MTAPKLCSAVLSGAAFSLALLVGAQGARAQAWVDEPGSVFVGADYAYGFSSSIVDAEGEDLPGQDIVNHAILASVEYTPIERLAISASIPALFLKYGGEPTGFFPRHGEYDDGSTHFALTDLKAVVRYQLFGPFNVVTPHIGGSIPTTSYETQGYAGAGRHLKKLHAGLSAGTMPSWLPRAYLHAHYEFSLAESYEGDDENFHSPDMELTQEQRDILADYGQNSSDLNLQLGYFFLPELQAFLSFDGHWQHGGANFNDPSPEVIVLEFHDGVLNEDYYLLGAGASYQITDKLSVSATFRYYLAGKNSRDVNALNLGLGYQIL